MVTSLNYYRERDILSHRRHSITFVSYLLQPKHGYTTSPPQLETSIAKLSKTEQVTKAL